MWDSRGSLENPNVQTDKGRSQYERRRWAHESTVPRTPRQAHRVSGISRGAIREPQWVRRPGRAEWTLALIWELPRPSLACLLSAGDLVAEAAGGKPPPDSLMCSG